MSNRITLPCNMDSIEAEAILQGITEYPSNDEEYLMVDKMPNYLFYQSESRGRRRVCTCSRAGCGRFVMERKGHADFFRHKHNDTIECPECHGHVRMIALHKMRTFGSINDKGEYFTICRVGPDGELVLLSGYGRRQFGWCDLRPHIDFSAKAVTILKQGKRFQKKTRLMPLDGCGRIWDWEWHTCTRVSEPFQPFFYLYGGASYIIAPERVAQTELKYSQVDEFFFDEKHVDLECCDEPVRDFVKYLSAYSQYPNIEMAVKIGMYDAVCELVGLGKKNAAVLDWSASTIPGFLRMSKQDAKMFMAAEGDLKLLIAFRDAKKKSMVPDLKKYIEMLRVAGGVKYAEKLTEVAGSAGCTIQVAAQYLAKNAGLGEHAHVLTLWRDYLDLARNLGYDMLRRDVAMPRNLKERHDAAAETVRYQKWQIDEEKYREFNKRMRKMYEFEYGGLSIVVPGCVEEIINEGRVLRHCVGGYAARHFNGQTVILFLRRSRKKHTPFVTMELPPRDKFRSEVKVRQIHGYRNERYGTPGKRAVPPRTKYQWFFDVYFKWLKNGSKRDKQGRPILPVETGVSA